MAINIFIVSNKREKEATKRERFSIGTIGIFQWRNWNYRISNAVRDDYLNYIYINTTWLISKKNSFPKNLNFKI